MDRSLAATRQPLNLHAVARERPDLLELGIRRSGPARLAQEPDGRRGGPLHDRE